MTIQEWVYRFRIALDQVNSLALPDIQPEEFIEIANLSIERFIKQRYGAKSNLKGEGFEETQKRTDDLRSLVKSADLPNSNGDNTYTLPDDYLFLLSSHGIAKQADCTGSKIVLLKQTKLDEIHRVLADPFNKPKGYKGLLQYVDNKLKVYSEMELDKLEIVYLRTPAKVSFNPEVNCDLPDHTHQEIIDIMVGYTLEILESQRFQSQQISSSQNE